MTTPMEALMLVYVCGRASAWMVTRTPGAYRCQFCKVTTIVGRDDDRDRLHEETCVVRVADALMPPAVVVAAVQGFARAVWSDADDATYKDQLDLAVELLEAAVSASGYQRPVAP